MSGTDRATPGGDPSDRLMHRWKVVGVVYRSILILGMLAFPLFAILILFTAQFHWWDIFIPTALILLGVLLAWFEYMLYKRL